MGYAQPARRRGRLRLSTTGRGSVRGAGRRRSLRVAARRLSPCASVACRGCGHSRRGARQLRCARSGNHLWARRRVRVLFIEPATVDDTDEYVRHRRNAAGGERAVLPDDAIKTLHELSQGSPREIDRLATAALREAARRKKRLVDKEDVDSRRVPFAGLRANQG